MKITRKLLSFLLVLSMLFTLLIGSGIMSEAEYRASSTAVSNWGTRGETATSLTGYAQSYYTGSYTYDKLSDQSSSTLLSSLRTLMKSTHSYTSSYDDCHYKANITDCEDGNNKVSLIYTSYDATMNQWNGWNREHIWPKSLGGDSTKGGGADLHHIRPSDSGVNSSRGNKKYGNVDGGTAKYGTDPAVGVLGGHYSSTYFEPLDNVKGDVARICLYVYVRWGSDWGATSITKVFQSVDVLLEWCELDPVDTWEMGRNDAVQNIQGNRNVFIDYPELAWLIFGESVPDNMVTPSGEASNGSTGGSGGGTVTPPINCTHGNTAVRDAKAATCAQGGYSGDTYCTDCGEKISTGTVTPATGRHTWGAWVENTTAGTKTRTCSVCKKTETVSIDVTPCDHNNTELRNASSATCAQSGYSGDTYCTDCGEKISTGTITPATGRHTWGAWGENTTAGTKTHTCSVCKKTETVSIDVTPVDPVIPTDSQIPSEIIAIIATAKTEEEKILIYLSLGLLDFAIIDSLG